jgi:hypothetical protein
MSAEVRTAIANAASTVEGVNCSPYFRQTTKPGDAQVRLDRMDRDDTGFGFMAVWQVVVMLAQDLQTAEKWLDEHIDSLVAAIREEMVVTTVTPQQLALDTGLVPCVVIQGNRAT